MFSRAAVIWFCHSKLIKFIFSKNRSAGSRDDESGHTAYGIPGSMKLAFLDIKVF